MRNKILVLFLISASVLMARPIRAEYFQDQVKVLMEIRSYADGRHSIKYFAVEPETGMYVPFSEFDEDAQIEAKPVPLQQAVVTFSWHWQRPATIPFNVTQLSKAQLGKIRTILNKYNNQRRGNNMVPTMTINNKIVSVKPMTQFQNPLDYYYQLDFDGNNTAVMTGDNQFFKDLQGIYFDPDQVSLTKIMAVLTITKEGGRSVTTFWISESDVYLIKDFFTANQIIYNLLGTAAFKMSLGYQPTTWSHDFLAGNNDHVTKERFNNPTSSVWQSVSHPRDDFYYMDALSLGSIQFLETPRLLPEEDEVIDVGGYNLPERAGNDLDLGSTPILFLTNLKAYTGAKKLKAEIWRITTDNPPQQVLVTSMAGNTIRYPFDIGSFTNVYPDIFLNDIRIGLKSKLDALKNAVKNFGRMNVLIDGFSYEKALRIKVRISGRLTEKGKIVSITRNYWLVDSEPEPQPAAE